MIGVDNNDKTRSNRLLTLRAAARHYVSNGGSILLEMHAMVTWAEESQE